MAFVWTKKGVIAATVVASIAVVGLGINFAIMPTLGNISTANTNIADAQDTVSSLETQLVKIQESKKVFENVKTINKSLGAQFPDTGETQLIIEEILTAANANGIPSSSVTSLQFVAPVLKTPTIPVVAPTTPTTPGKTTPSKPTPTPTPAPTTPPAGSATAPVTTVADGYAELALTVSIDGNPGQIKGFLNSINKLDRAILIKAATFSTDPTTGVVTLGFTATSFIYAPIPEPADATGTTTK